MNKKVKIGEVYRNARETKTLFSASIWYYIYDIKDDLYYFLMIASRPDYFSFELKKVGKINAEVLIFEGKDTKKADPKDLMKLISLKESDREIIKTILSSDLP